MPLHCSTAAVRHQMGLRPFVDSTHAYLRSSCQSDLVKLQWAVDERTIHAAGSDVSPQLAMLLCVMLHDHRHIHGIAAAAPNRQCDEMSADLKDGPNEGDRICKQEAEMGQHIGPAIVLFVRT